jgi:tripartite-type tricarboxylate transporter receptor subunit TctC
MACCAAGTPKAVLDRLAGELPKVLALQDVRQRFISQGMDVTPGDGAKLAAVIKADLAQWTPIVRQSGAKVD